MLPIGGVYNLPPIPRPPPKNSRILRSLQFQGIKSLVAKDFNWMVNKKCDASNQVFSPFLSGLKQKSGFQITFLLTYCCGIIDSTWVIKTYPTWKILHPLEIRCNHPHLVAHLTPDWPHGPHLHWFLVAFEEMPAAHHQGWLMDPPGTWLSHEKLEKFSLVVADEQVLWWIFSYRSPIESTEST